MAKRPGFVAKTKQVTRVAKTAIQRSRQVSPEEKAAFHQITGAGRSHVTRPFLGLTPDDEAAIVERVDRFLTQAVRET